MKRMALFKYSLSKLTLVLIIFSLTIYKFVVLPQESTLTWDNFGYYLYLPKFFVYHDPHMTHLDEWLVPANEKYKNTPNLYQINPVSDSSNIIRYPIGQAFFYAPFFFMAHWVTLLTPYPADGFSLIYQLFIRWGCFLYLIAGLVLMRKALLHIFDEKTTVVTLILLILGANLHIYAGTSSPHETLFLVYALMLYISTKRTNYFSLSFWIKTAALTGIACITRPTDVIIGLIPLLWGMKNFRDILNHLKLWFTKKIHIFIVSLLVFGAVLLIQMLYWKIYAGNWVNYTYDATGEFLNLESPYTINFLFSFRKGWFIYTPLMFVALFGFIVLFRQRKDIFIPVFTFYIINLYLISSWITWWYANSFSSRVMVQSLALTIIPLGFLYQYFRKKRILIKSLFLGLLILLVSLNLFQTWQFHKSIFPLDRLTRKAYMYIFLKTKIDFEKRESLMLINRNIDETYIPNPERYSKRTIGFSDYEDDNQYLSKQQICDTMAYSGSYSLRLDSACLFSNDVRCKYSLLTDKPHAWIKASGWIYIPNEYDPNMFSLVCQFKHNEIDYKYRIPTFDSNKVKPNQWNYIDFLYLTPEIVSKDDMLLVYFWLRGNNPIWIDNFRVDVYEPL